MFTPPPSPLPPRRIMELERPPDLLLNGARFDDDDSDAHSFIEEGSVIITPPTPPPTMTQTPSIRYHKGSRRRTWIPVLATVLLCLAVGASGTWKRSPSKIPQPRPIPTFAVSPASAPLSPNAHGSWRTHVFKHTGSLRRKKRQSNNIAAALPTGTTSAASATGSSASTSTGSPTIPNPAYPVPTPFPQPFDTNFSYNFTTSSCQSFFATSLISNITFRSCRPLSLLLPASAAFFAAQSNLTLLTSIIGGTCDTTGATENQCLDTMAYLAQEIQKDTVCGKDLGERNALVTEALSGFENYGFMRQAGCLINQNTNSYCLVDAVASPSPSDFYFYTLPLGTPLPNNTKPSCSTCTESLLAIYATQASNTSLMISKTYPAAADLAIKGCGARYAVAMNASSGALAVRIPMETGGMMIVGMVMGMVAGVLS
ncbi:hypothetical protein FRB93_006034, partial [Tulasnella sp. JGI-2019a]